MGIIRDIETLVMPVQIAWLYVKAELAQMGIDLMVIETRRTAQIQRAYYAQGRESLEEVNLKRNSAGLWSISAKANERIITRTMESIHFYDCALDFALRINGKPSWDTKADINHDDISDYENVGAIAKTHGFKWGGDFRFKDYAHLQYTDGLTIEDLRAGKRPVEDVLNYI